MKADDKFVGADLRLWRMVHFMTEDFEPKTKPGYKFYYMSFGCRVHPEREQAIKDAIAGMLGPRLVKITSTGGPHLFCAKILYGEQ